MSSQKTQDKFDDKIFIYTWRIKDFQDHYKNAPNGYYNIISEKFSSPGPHITQSKVDSQSFIYKWRLQLRIHGQRENNLYSYNSIGHYNSNDKRQNEISLNLTSYDEESKEVKEKQEDKEINYKCEVVRSYPDNHIIPIISQGAEEKEEYEPISSEKKLGNVANMFPDKDVSKKIDLRIRVYIKTMENKSRMTLVTSTTSLSLPHLNDFFDKKSFSDVEFTFDCGNSVKASKIILVSKSEYFKKMFTGEWKESRESKIHITDTKYKIFCYLIKYLYTNELDEGLSLEELKDLYLESDLRDLEGLRKIVSICIGERMNVENWEQVLKFGFEIDNDGIKYSATLFGINNWEEICAKDQHDELFLDNILSLKVILLNVESSTTSKKFYGTRFSLFLSRSLIFLIIIIFLLFYLIVTLRSSEVDSYPESPMTPKSLEVVSNLHPMQQNAAILLG